MCMCQRTCHSQYRVRHHAQSRWRFCTARSPRCPQAKVVEEQRAVEAECGEALNSDAIAKMVYLDACLKETVRQVYTRGSPHTHTLTTHLNILTDRL